MTENIKQLLPEEVSVGSGFVICDSNTTTFQLDIIIYRNDFHFLEKENFVIVSKESVLVIVEVKTKLNFSNVYETNTKDHLNWTIDWKQNF